MRGKTNASFVCPVSGCSGTFTGHSTFEGRLLRLLCEAVLTCRSRSHAFTYYRRDTISMQAAWVWERVC